ncbi:MAG: hypothetical protein E6K68_06280 [Nitrospirae bacterium]|nr:MAG: hypothetical protein E6K68_06280 [Nitrospirota bacterium]
MPEMMGGFWSSIPFKSDGKTRRIGLDQARMQLAQQLLAAILNVGAFGTSDGGLIATAKSNYCGTNRDAILASASALNAFNQSGDSLTPSPAPPGFPGKADPRGAQSIAIKALWDTLP